MTWTEAPPRGGSFLGRAVSLRIGINHKLPMVIFVVGIPLADELDWKQGSRVRLFWGGGTHKGLVRLQLAKDSEAGYKLKQMSKRSFTLGFSTPNFPPGARTDSHKYLHPEFRIPEKTMLEISLPKWFYNKLGKYENVDKKTLEREAIGPRIGGGDPKWG